MNLNETDSVLSLGNSITGLTNGQLASPRAMGIGPEAEAASSEGLRLVGRVGTAEGIVAKRGSSQ